MEKEPIYQEQILRPIIEIEKEHKQLCEEIKDVIVSGTQVRPSFQLMIINKINSSILKYMNLFAFAQGESSEIEMLKTAIEHLVIDNDLKKKVERYIELEKLLADYNKIDELTDKIDQLWTFIHGGGYLGGFDACQLCDPTKSVPTRT